MMWVFAVLIVLVIGGIAVVASGGGDPLAPVYDDRPDVVVPASGPLTAGDLHGIRFTTAFRGYRASEVDALLERLSAQLPD
ncbi:MAG: DivIVA domain-containing protein [Propionibacteriales bacterium]|nr:DivIVA domain-containing protein [Propionibacteriales bacterium]